MLNSAGITEAMAREHSLPWLAETAISVQREKLGEVALEARMNFSAVAAATYGEGALDAFNEDLAGLEDPDFTGSSAAIADDELRLAEMDALSGVIPIPIGINA